MGVRLIATDLDGTLLRRDGTISDRTRSALARAVAAGIDLVVVTARPPRYLDAIVERLDLRGVAICANGALLYDLARREVVGERSLDQATARTVVAALAPLEAGIGFAVETGTRVVFEPSFAKEDNGDVRHPVPSLDAMWQHGLPIVKLLVWSADTHADALLTAAVAAVAGAAEVTHSGGRGLLEVSAVGVTKVAALAEICAARGISSHDVIAFGDMPNDIAMLTWAGRGYAVANAHPDVIAAADSRTRSNEEDGVAAVVERLMDFPAVGGPL